jgi:phage tail sheath protein FI
MSENADFKQNGIEFNKIASAIAIGAPSNHVVHVVSTAPDADASMYPYGVPVLVGNDAAIAKLDGTNAGTGFLIHAIEKIKQFADCRIYVIRVEEGVDATATATAVIGGIDGSTGQKTGIAAIVNCLEKPTIIAASGYSHDQGVAQALTAMGKKVLAVPVLNLESGLTNAVAAAGDALGNADTGFDAAIVAVGNVTYQGSFGEVVMPADIVATALYASLEVYENPGHRGVAINAIDHQYEYSFTDAGTEGNLLNKHGICYFASTSAGGFSLIGNRTLTGRFIPDVGLQLEINRKLVANLELSHGKRLTPTFINQKLLVINNWLDSLNKSEIVAPKSRCYLHPSKNDSASMSQGRWYIVVEYDGYPVNENPVIELFENNELAAAALV